MAPIAKNSAYGTRMTQAQSGDLSQQLGGGDCLEGIWNPMVSRKSDFR